MIEGKEDKTVKILLEKKQRLEEELSSTQFQLIKTKDLFDEKVREYESKIEDYQF